MSKSRTAARSTSGRNEPFQIRPIPLMHERGGEWNAIQPGMRVRCADPGRYSSIVAAMLRGRIGTVSDLQSNSARPVVIFPAVGTRKAYRWVPELPSDLSIVDRPTLKTAE